jgi:hypothetical protein
MGRGDGGGCTGIWKNDVEMGTVEEEKGKWQRLESIEKNA